MTDNDESPFGQVSLLGMSLASDESRGVCGGVELMPTRLRADGQALRDGQPALTFIKAQKDVRF